MKAMVLVQLLLGAQVAMAARPDDPPAQPTVPPPAAPDAAPPAVSTAPPWPGKEVPVGVWDIVATGALGVGVLVVQFGLPNPTQPKWGSSGFDDSIRGTLRFASQADRNAAATASDVLVYSLAALPFINAFLVAGWEHGRMDVAWKLALLDAETLLTVTLVTLSLQKLLARERPFVQECVSNPKLSDCSISGRYASFPSAHTSVAFAAVALECFHHGFLETNHTGWGAIACPAAAVAATLTAVLRIAADRHWATDVIAGAALGGALGYAVPALHLAAAGVSGTAVITPVVGPSGVGLTLAGRF